MELQLRSLPPQPIYSNHPYPPNFNNKNHLLDNHWNSSQNSLSSQLSNFTPHGIYAQFPVDDVIAPSPELRYPSQGIYSCDNSSVVVNHNFTNMSQTPPRSHPAVPSQPPGVPPHANHQRPNKTRHSSSVPAMGHTPGGSVRHHPPPGGKPVKSTSVTGLDSRKPSFTTGNREVLGEPKKKCGAVVMDRKQAVFTIQNNLPTVTPQQVPMKPSDYLAALPTSAAKINSGAIPPQNKNIGSGIYQPISNMNVRKGSLRDGKRLECDPDGRVYELVQTKVVESSIDGPKSLNIDQRSINNQKQENRKHSLDSVKKSRKNQISPLARQDHYNQHRDVADSSVHSNGYGEKYYKDSPNSFTSILSNPTSKFNISSDSVNRSIDNRLNCKATEEAIERIKKNVEKKEEFLKRPSEPLWSPESKPPAIHREYHVNPQKFQKPLWPPPNATVPPSPGAITKALSFVLGHKADGTSLRRVRSEIDHCRRRHSEPHTSSTPNTPLALHSVMTSLQSQSSSQYGEPISQTSQFDIAPDSVSLRSFVTGSSKSLSMSGSTESISQNKYGKGFVTTLSKIQENIPTPEQGSSSSLISGKSSSNTAKSTPMGTPSGSQTSLNSPTIKSLPLAWVGDNERIKQLQIVSKRAKKFETSAQERESLSKSAFHRHELSRLSQHSKTPNVAKRREEFEKKDDYGMYSSKGWFILEMRLISIQSFSLFFFKVFICRFIYSFHITISVSK